MDCQTLKIPKPPVWICFSKMRCCLYGPLKHTNKRSLQNILNMFCHSVIDYLLLSWTLFIQLYFIITASEACLFIHTTTQNYRNINSSNICCLTEHFRRVVTLLECSEDKWGNKKNIKEYKQSCSTEWTKDSAWCYVMHSSKCYEKIESHPDL